MITQNLINCMYLVGLTNETPNVRKIDGSSAKINYYTNSGNLVKVRLQTVESKKRSNLCKYYINYGYY